MATGPPSAPLSASCLIGCWSILLRCELARWISTPMESTRAFFLRAVVGLVRCSTARTSSRNCSAFLSDLGIDCLDRRLDEREFAFDVFGSRERDSGVFGICCHGLSWFS